MIYSYFTGSFITYRSCKHLDGKHTVFGKLVGGIDTLANMERVNTDNKDCPIEDLVIEKCHVFVDPYTEADEEVTRIISGKLILVKYCKLLSYNSSPAYDKKSSTRPERRKHL